MITFRKHLLVFTLLSIYFFANAQNKSDFFLTIDKSIEKLYQNPDDCLIFTQSLLISEQSTEHKIILQNIMAQAYAMKGDYVQSIRTSLDNENQSISAGITYDFSNFYLNYALAEQYQNLRLFEQSESLIDRINKKQFPNIPHIHFDITKAKLLQLQAINYGVKNQYEQAEKAFLESDKILQEKTFENQAIKTENLLFLAGIYLTQNKKEQASLLINKALPTAEALNSSYLIAFAYHRKARLEFLNNNYTEAITLLEKALAKIDKSEYLSLKGNIYEAMSRSYLGIKDESKYHYYNNLFIASRSKLDANSKEGIRYLVKLTESYENKSLAHAEWQKKQKFSVILVIIAAALLSLALYYIFEIKRNKELKKQLEFFEKQEKINLAKKTSNTEPALILEKTEKPNLPDTIVKKTSLLSKEKESEILEKLNALENSDRFLSKDMSLAVLSGQLETNTKYLSEVINKYKGKNFNHYINELRVNHIAYLLKTNPAYLNYKVSYLAEISGFSSHSSFATIFKNITGMSPNVYIQQISNSKKS